MNYERYLRTLIWHISFSKGYPFASIERNTDLAKSTIFGDSLDNCYKFLKVYIEMLFVQVQRITHHFEFLQESPPFGRNNANPDNLLDGLFPI